MVTVRRIIIPTMLGGALLCGCAAQPSAASSASPQLTETSILAASTPAPGSTVSGPVNELKLHFNPPALLNEITVEGPQGLMPVMVHPVGESADYSIPVSGLGRGAYTVNWRATAQGREHNGSFGFSVK